MRSRSTSLTMRWLACAEPREADAALMRFWLAVLAGAVVLGVAFLRLPGSNPPLMMAIVVLAALGAGFFAGRRGALIGFLIVYVGNLLFVASTIARYGFGYGTDSSGAGGFIVRLLIVQVVLLQFAIPAAIAGWSGTYARRRWLGARPSASTTARR